MTHEEEARGAVVLAGREPPPGKLTFEQFLAWCDEDTRAEWVDGEVAMVSPASYRHAELADFLLILVRLWVEAHDLGVVLSAPFLMRLPAPLQRAREPDLLFVAQEHRDRLRETYLDGAADLVVEVVSPESAARDRGEKLGEYEAGGIPEYWLIDPDRRQAEFYRLGPDGRYHLALGGSAGSYESAVLAGFRLPVEWLWQQPLPKVRDALRALGLP
ncbi:MAG: Uma2 family endonuclease [Chloroflexi bacterium]|nr:Uma2 family endonuclease [Chloroflexota bacterium]